MVAFSSHKQKGNGAIDNIMKMFSAQKYAGEHHAISFAPDTYGKMMNWMGPGTDIQARTNQDLTPKSNSMPIQKSDLASYSHDISYYKAKKHMMQTQHQKIDKNNCKKYGKQTIDLLKK